jgi:hypothetical protein
MISTFLSFGCSCFRLAVANRYWTIKKLTKSVRVHLTTVFAMLTWWQKAGMQQVSLCRRRRRG